MPLGARPRSLKRSTGQQWGRGLSPGCARLMANAAAGSPPRCPEVWSTPSCSHAGGPHPTHHSLLTSRLLLPEETTFEAGVKVQIHSQSEPPFVQELGFGVAPGFQTFVATQEQRVSPKCRLHPKDPSSRSV